MTEKIKQNKRIPVIHSPRVSKRFVAIFFREAVISCGRILRKQPSIESVSSTGKEGLGHSNGGENAA